MELQYYRTFTENTSQGLVGLLKPLTSNKLRNSRSLFRLENTLFKTSATDYFFVKDDPAYPIFIFKIPKEVNTLVDHELKVSKDMEDLSAYLPHFNRIFEIKRDVKCYIPTKIKKSKDEASFNPFEKYNCIRDVLIIEYIPSSLTLLDYIRKTHFSGCTKSLIHQLILGLFIAQQEKNFTHYDLHLENVLLRRCLQRTFFLYKFSYEGVVMNRLVYTDGYFPVLFDYGFAYSKGLEGTSYNNSLFFTNKGYTPFMFDDINDFKTLMVRLAYTHDCPQQFKKFADDHFLKSNKLKFKLSKETGWIKSTVSSTARIVYKKIEEVMLELDHDQTKNFKDSFIFKELDNIIDLFGILIKLPIGQTDFKIKNLKEVVLTFLTEWNKIDVWFSKIVADDKLNIMKKIFESINNLIMEEEDQILTKNLTIDDLNHKIKLKMFEIFDAFGDFIDVENLNYDKFFLSIIELSNFIEHVTYGEIQRYKKLFNFQMDGWTLFNSIEKLVEPEEPYSFKEGDNIVVFDCIDKLTSSFELKEADVIELLNGSSSLKLQLNILDNLPKVDY
jgi:hypothetical protein